MFVSQRRKPEGLAKEIDLSKVTNGREQSPYLSTEQSHLRLLPSLSFGVLKTIL